VPEASVDEHSDTLAGEDDVRPDPASGQVDTVVTAIPEPSRVQRAAQRSAISGLVSRRRLPCMFRRRPSLLAAGDRGTARLVAASVIAFRLRPAKTGPACVRKRR
jgi:hypothetical protein